MDEPNTPAQPEHLPLLSSEELMRQAEELFRQLEGKPPVSESLQKRNEWITESPAAATDGPTDGVGEETEEDPIL